MSVKSSAQPKDDAVGEEPEKAKRAIKPTAKGLEMFIENCQKTRNIKCKQANKLMEMLKEHKSKEDATKAQSKLYELIKLCNEAKESHESLVKLPLPEDELKRQNQWFQSKMETFDGFIKEVKMCFTEVEQQIKHTAVDDESATQPVIDEGEKGAPIVEGTAQCSEINSDEIGPDDSVSNVSKSKSKPKPSCSSSHAS